MKRQYIYSLHLCSTIFYTIRKVSSLLYNSLETPHPTDFIIEMTKLSYITFIIQHGRNSSLAKAGG